MGRLLKSNKGIAMVTVICIVSFVFLLCVALINYNDSHTKNVTLSAKIEDALQIAEAGYNHYMYYLNQDSDFYKNPNGINIRGPNGEEMGFVPESFDDKGLPEVYNVTTYRLGESVIGYYQIRIKQPSVNEDLTVISTGWTHENPDIKKTVRVRLHKRSFAEYVDFTDSSGDVRWITGNTADGPVFCNDDILVDGNPVFKDNIYTAGEMKILSGSPIIHGRLYEGKDGIEPAIFPVTNPEIENWAKNGGLHLTGRTCIFIKDNKLVIRNKNENNDYPYEVDLPKSGVVFVRGKVFISGILDGKLTVYATDNIYITGKDPTNFSPGNAAKTGKVLIGSIEYNIGIAYKDINIPLDKNATGSNYSDDMLGLISEKNIIIATRTWPSSNVQGYTTYSSYGNITVKDMIIYGALMTTGGQFTVEDYDNVPVSGRLSVYGSKIQNSSRGPVCTYNSRGHVSGYSKQDRFDYRLKTMSPPHFVEPANSGWEVRSWEEITNP